MPLHVVTRKKTDTPSRVPDALQLGTAMLASLREHQVLANMASWLPLSRRAGHGTRGLFTFAVVFLMAGRSWGIRPFALQFGTALARLVAPVAGLIALPTAASMSRALGSLTHVAVRSCLDQLLAGDVGVKRLLGSPHVLHRDAQGQGWHVLDLDPTVEAFRQRGLPDDAALPQPNRLAPGTPGYTGHKRGDLRIRHVPVQHAGAGAWLAYRLDATGGSLLPVVADVVRVARNAIPVEGGAPRVVLRADGEFGSVGSMRTIVAEGVAVLTRLSRYALLDRDEVVALLPGLTWRVVRSSGGGPLRQAADLGLFTLYPDDGAAGSKDGPVQVRVVVTRFARSSPPEHGVLRDGFQIELFATTLPSDAWPPEDVVALYFGRSAMENRFAQEDREFGIDRTFSYHPPGQEWMSGIALFLWNVLISRGVAADPLPVSASPQAARPATAEPSLTDSVPPWPLPASESRNKTGVAPVVEAEPTQQRTTPESDHPGSAQGASPEESALHKELWTITRSAFANLEAMPGWRLDDAEMEIRCPNEKRLFPFSSETHIRKRKHGPKPRHRLWIRTQTGACDGCPVRTTCRTTDRPNIPKQLARDIKSEVKARVAQLLKDLRRIRRPKEIRTGIERRRDRLLASSKTVIPATRPFLVPLPDGIAGHLLPDSPLFLPAQTRARARSLLSSLTLHVATTPRPAQAPRQHPLLARDVADRQRRRRTWRQREDRWWGVAATLVLSGPQAAFVRDRLISADTYRA